MEDEPYEDHEDLIFLFGDAANDTSSMRHPAQLIRGVSQREVILSFHPHPFALTGWMSARLLPGFIGQLIVARALVDTVNDETLLEGVRRAETQMQIYMPQIMQARRGLRHDICIQIGAVLDGSSPLESLLDRLAPSLYLLKVSFSLDIGVQMCARRFIRWFYLLLQACSNVLKHSSDIIHKEGCTHPCAGNRNPLLECAGGSRMDGLR